MRKAVIILITLLSVTAGSCGQSWNKQVSKMESITDSTETIKYYKDIDITNVQHIRRFGHYKGVQQPIISVISARSELEQYYETHVKCIYSSNDGQFRDATKIYSDDFFAKNFLVIVLLEEGSGSISHKVERIDKNGDIIINRFIPQVGTDDMAEWNIVIELNNDFKLEQYRVVLVDKVHE